VPTGLSLATGKEMTLFKSVIGDGRKQCDACAVEGNKKGFPRARMFFESGLKFVFPLPLFCSKTAKSNVAANIGYGKNEKTKYGCT
jgi:hypothetical protein